MSIDDSVCLWYQAYKQQCRSSRKIFPDPADMRRYDSVSSYVEAGCLDCKGLDKNKDCYESYLEIKRYV